jgi:hypothetical protein
VLRKRNAPRSSTVHVRAIVAAALALGLILALAATAVAAPVVTIDSDSGPPEGSATNGATPVFRFTVDLTAITIDCSFDQGMEDWQPCSDTYAPAAALQPDGTWFFRVRASDGIDPPTIETRSFTLDTQARLSIDSGPSDPSDPTNDTTPSFGFTAEAGASSIECAIDQDPYELCAGPRYDVVTPLSDGTHVFHLQVTDALGNSGDAPRTFTVDTRDPAVSVASGPRLTSIHTPLFGFSAEPGARVECAIDHGSPSPSYGSCTTTSSYLAPQLADGSWVFHVRATDAAENHASDDWPFTVDSQAPALSIVSGPSDPSNPTNDTTPSFGLSVDADATVECSVDQGTPDWEPCTSTTAHTVSVPLAEGSYTFRVRATDGVGNYADESRTFTVDTTPPTLSVSFGPSGATSDSTPLFGFTAEAGATVACSIDQGTPAYGPCTSATAHAAVAPLADGAYDFRVLATDRAGNQTTATRAFTVATGSPSPAPGPDPTPVTPTPTKPRLMSPFPLVRISGTLTSRGARVTLLSVRAPRGALVRVAISPPCGKKRHARRCRVVRAAGTVGRGDLLGFRGLARSYRSGTVIVVRVWSIDRIGKYTRFTIVRGKAPRRVDQCLMPGAASGSRCPSE